MQKKLFSLLLVFTVLFASVPVQAFAEEIGNEPQAILTPAPVGDLVEDGIRLTKTATDLGNDDYQITLMAEGKDVVVENNADVVIVFDSSNSMKSKDFKNAKNAAGKLIDKLLTNGSGNQVGVVSFNNKAKKIADLSAYSENSNKMLKDKINAIAQNDGTNTQMGIYLANKMLKASNAKHKIVVLLSDGSPTYSANPTHATIPEKDCWWHDLLTGLCVGNVLNAKIDKYDYNKCAGTGKWNLDVNWVNVNCVHGNKYGVGFVLTTTCAYAAKFEANRGKQADIQYITVAYNINDKWWDSKKDERNFMNDIASSGKRIDANSDNLVSAFEGIGNSITNTLGASVTDTLGDMVDLVGTDYSASKGDLSYDQSTKSFTWNPGSIVENTPVTLTYKVHLNVEKIGFSMSKAYPTSSNTKINYTYKKADKTMNFPVTKVVGKYYTLTVQGIEVDDEGAATGKTLYTDSVINAQNNVNQWGAGRTGSLTAKDVAEYNHYGDKNAEITFTDKDIIVEFKYTKIAPQTVDLTVQHIYKDKNGKEIVKDSGIVEAKVNEDFNTNSIATREKTINDILYVYDNRTPGFKVKAANNPIVEIFYKPDSKQTKLKLTIEYVLEDGTEFKEPETKYFEAGAAIAKDTLQPDIKDYKFKSGDYSNLSGDETKGYTMPETGATITLTYTKKVTPPTTPALTIKYVLEGGTETKAPETKYFEAGTKITADLVVSDIPGYTFKSGDYSNLSGNETQGYTMPETGATITLTYTKKVTPPTTSALTIKYVLEDGTEIKTSEPKQIKEGTEITADLVAPNILGYIFKFGDYREVIKDGPQYFMPAKDATVTLTYSRNETPPTTPTLTIKYVFSDNGTSEPDVKINTISQGTVINLVQYITQYRKNYAHYSYNGADTAGFKDNPDHVLILDGDATITLKYEKISSGGSHSGHGSHGGSLSNNDTTIPLTIPEVVQPETVPLTPPVPAPTPAPTAPKGTEVVKNGAVPLASPKTGEATSVLSLLGVMAVSAACITMIKKRKNDDEQA